MAIRSVSYSNTAILTILTPIAVPVAWIACEFSPKASQGDAASSLAQAKINRFKDRVEFSTMALFSAVIHATIAAACASLKNLSLIFAVSSGLSAIAFAVSAYLALSNRNEIARLQQIADESIAPGH